jgi:hypothetical protein
MQYCVNPHFWDITGDTNIRALVAPLPCAGLAFIFN